MHSNVTLNYLSAQDGEKIAYKMSEGKGPTLIWCGGLKSDMEGGKATYLHDWAIEEGRSYIRFDYYGHGRGDAKLKDFALTRCAVFVVQNAAPT